MNYSAIIEFKASKKVCHVAGTLCRFVFKDENGDYFCKLSDVKRLRTKDKGKRIDVFRCQECLDNTTPVQEIEQSNGGLMPRFKCRDCKHWEFIKEDPKFRVKVGKCSAIKTLEEVNGMTRTGGMDICGKFKQREARR
jgi:ribosomal protein S27E